MKYLYFFLFSFFLWIATLTLAAEETPNFLSLKGFLDKDSLAKARETVLSLEGKAAEQILILEINSTSADLLQVLEFAKTLYALKTLKGLKVIVYLNDNVVGPAAILPFLADELYSSLLVAWGNIPLGTEDVLPANILRNRVRSFIDERHPNAALLYVLADAMSDPSLQVIEEGRQWKIAENLGKSSSTISSSHQTLVVNQNQLKQLNLVKQIIPFEKFKEQFHLEESPVETQENSSPVENQLKNFIHFNKEGPNLVGYIYVGNHESMISQSTWIYVKKALDYYKETRPSFIILELDTPGGEVFAAQKISDALKEMDIQENIPIVTFINNWAISAGAMLAYSSRFITVAKDGSMGAAEPVYAGGEGKLESASEKVNSALRTDFANRARFFDRDPSIAEAMVDKDVILVWRHGRVVKLDQESQIRSSGPDPDILISGKGKLLTLSADQLIDYKVADWLLKPEKLSEVTEQEHKQGYWPLSKTPLVQIPFFAKIPEAKVDAYQMDWKTQFFAFLTTPLVSSLLFMGLIIGIYMELSQPGLSLPGMVAAASLFLIILSSFALELASWLELILLLTGLILILVEVFILPSFGLAGVLGIVLFIIGLLGMLLPGLSSINFEPDTQTLNAAGQYILERLAWLGGALIISLGVIALLARFALPSFTGFKRFVLAGHEQEAAEGFIAGDDPRILPQPREVGEALTPLRPAGKIVVNERIYDAVSTGDFIEAGEAIQVVRLEGSVIVVGYLEEKNV